MNSILAKVRVFFIKNSSLIIFNILVLFILFPITYLQVVINDLSDYPAHLLTAKLIVENGKFENLGRIVPHPLFHFGIIFFKQIFNFSYMYGQIITILLSYTLLGTVLYSRVLAVIGPMNRWKVWMISFGIIIAGPIFIFANIDHKFYFGYIGFAVYHNPTVILLRPLALILWLHTITNINNKVDFPIILSGFFVMVLATLAKPSYSICLVPGIGLIILWQIIRRRKVNWWFMVFGFFLPAFIILGWQYLVTFQSEAQNTSIIFAPFKVIRWMSHKIVFKFLLSIIFPLSTSIFYLKRVIHDRAMMIAWIIFGFGSFFGYFLAEGGKSIYSGNFLWSTQITLFILFFQSIIFVLNQKTTDKNSLLARIIIWTIFGTQVICGIIYYVHCFINPVYI